MPPPKGRAGVSRRLTLPLVCSVVADLHISYQVLERVWYSLFAGTPIIITKETLRVFLQDELCCLMGILP